LVSKNNDKRFVMKKRVSGFYVMVIYIVFTMVFAFPGDLYAKNYKKAKNIILMIADGMGYSHFRAAQLFNREINNKDLNMVKLMNSGHTAYLVNDTADTTVTESAAAAGQMATGEKMTARVVSMAGDRITEVKSILELTRERNMATGLITTSGITDATPAAFSAHVPERRNESDIAAQQINKNIDVLMGGRKKFYLPSDKGGARKDGRDLTVEAAAAGYLFVETSKGLQAAPDNAKILGLFNMNNMSFEIERAKTSEPSLTEMSIKALKILSKNKNGFFAMIEGGRIDHASHGNDTASMIHDILAFDEAVGAVVDFSAKNPDTLIIIASDHETGSFNIIGRSKESKDYIGADMGAIAKINTPLETIAQKIKDDTRPENIKTVFKNYLFVDLTTDEIQIVANDALKKMDPYNYVYDYSHSIAFVLRPYHRASWGSQTHTAAPIQLFASGPGAENIKGIMHNTEVFTVIKKALKIK